jgi:hypothetical protein
VMKPVAGPLVQLSARHGHAESLRAGSAYLLGGVAANAGHLLRPSGRQDRGRARC